MLPAGSKSEKFGLVKEIARPSSVLKRHIVEGKVKGRWLA